MTASWISPEEVSPKPAGWVAADYRALAAPAAGLAEGHVFQLGDRSLEVLHIPGDQGQCDD